MQIPQVIRTRILASALALSATAFVGITVSEGYTDTAVVPTRNDRPTVGFGSTFNEDGTPVRMGEKTTPVRALIKAQAHLNKAETAFRATLPGVALYQAEYDVYMDWTYQFGVSRWESSSMHGFLMAGEYANACRALLRYKFSGGYDCSTPGNKICSGVWTRQLERHKKCMDAQGGTS